MPKKEPKAMFVITLPLKYEPWQRDIMDKRFELCRKVYNAMLGYEVKQYNKMLRDVRWIESSKIISEEYKNKGESKAKTPRLKEALDERNTLCQEYGFSEYSFTGAVKEFYKDRIDYSNHISSNTAALSIAKPMWAAYSALLYKNGDKVAFKKAGQWNSVATNGKSGIRLVNKAGDTLLRRTDTEKVFIRYGTTKGRVLEMPVILDGDVYAEEALTNPIKIIRLVRKVVKGKSQYLVQFTVEGKPPIKYAKDGEEKHPVGSGKVGIYIDTTKVVAVNKDGIHEFDLNEGLTDHSEEIAALQQYMDASRRRSNPDNFNEDGTAVKNGLIVDGKRVKLKWVSSKGYREARAKQADLHRKDAECRDLQRNILANKLLALGDEFYVNEYPFKFAMEKKKEQEQYPDGRIKSKKKAGKTIKQTAPATLIQKLDQRLKSRGYSGVTKINLTNVDKDIESYRTYYAKEMYRNAITSA